MGFEKIDGLRLDRKTDAIHEHLFWAVGEVDVDFAAIEIAGRPQPVDWPGRSHDRSTGTKNDPGLHPIVM